MILTDDGAAEAGRPRGAEGEDREVARDADLVHQHSQYIVLSRAANDPSVWPLLGPSPA